MSKGTKWRKVRCHDDLWTQLDNIVATEGRDLDRSTVTRRLWRLYIDRPAVRRAVLAMPDDNEK